MFFFGAPFFVHLVASGFADNPEKFDLTVSLTRWMSPFLAGLSLAGFIGAMLNVRGKFFAPAMAQNLFNLLVIAACLGAKQFEAATGLPGITAVAIAATLSGFLQVALTLPPLASTALYTARSAAACARSNPAPVPPAPTAATTFKCRFLSPAWPKQQNCSAHTPPPSLAAVAKGDVLFLILGLALSVPTLVFGSWLLTELLGTTPLLSRFAMAVLGWVAGDMAVSDPLIADWVKTEAPALAYAVPMAWVHGRLFFAHDRLDQIGEELDLLGWRVR
jgi:hypothetical protein